MLELTIENEGVFYQPLIEEDITLEWARADTPGKLTFKVLNDGSINFQEGNAVRFIVDGVKLFFGFVFTKKRDKEQLISVTAYDQLRYLKNKDSMKYTNKKASDIVKQIAKSVGMQCGEIADTEILISRREDNTTLFDMIKEALELTMEQSKKMYVLYDDFGKLTLKYTGDMLLDYVISGDNTENFSYESSIDGETYNQIILYCKDEDSGERTIYPVESTESIKKWGVLRLYEETKKPEEAQSKANALLGLYNRKRRSLSVSDVIGDVRVRAGCMLPVLLTLGDINANSYLLVENVKHKFKNNIHTMDLTLRGGEFV